MISGSSTNTVRLKAADVNFVRNQDLSVSYNGNRNSDKKAPSKLYTCYKCDKNFPSNQEVIMHLKLAHNACASSDCSQISDFKMHSSICANRGFVCTVCNLKFSEKYLLLMHFNEHIGVAFYVCEICKDGFQQRKDLQKHLLLSHQKNVCIPVIASHSKAVYQKCCQCSKYYRLFAEFEEHCSSCCNSSIFACSICQVNFSTISALDEHKLVEHKYDSAVKGNLAFKLGKRYFCSMCYIGFFNGFILKEHVKTHKMEASHICDVCHSTFTCDEDLQMHYLLHIEEHYVLHDVISQHLCNLCKKMFKTQKELKDHLPNCTVCFEDFLISSNEENSIDLPNKDNYAFQKSVESAVCKLDTSDVLIYALKAGEELLNCDDKECVIVMDLHSVFVLQRGICASESRMPDVSNSQAYNENDAIDTSLLHTHMFQILSPTNESISNLDLEINSENFQSLEDTRTVEKITNLDDLNDSSTPQDVPDNESMVAAPNSTFSINAEELYDNTLNKIEWSCNNLDIVNDVPYTNGISKNDNFLPESNDEISNLDLAHICNICKKAFSTKISLCFHIKGNHTGFDCYRCGSSFKSENELGMHEKASHPNAFHCNMCGVSFPKEHLLKKHKRCTHGGKHFLCNVCGKSYVLKNEFDVHLMLHKGETPPSKCEVCGKIYASVSNYMRHKAIHEGKSLPLKYKCTVCDKRFIARSPLKRHVATHIKKSNLTYECSECKMYFPPKLLTEHIKSHNFS